MRPSQDASLAIREDDGAEYLVVNTATERVELPAPLQFTDQSSGGVVYAVAGLSDGLTLMSNETNAVLRLDTTEGGEQIVALTDVRFGAAGLAVVVEDDDAGALTVQTTAGNAFLKLDTAANDVEVFERVVLSNDGLKLGGLSASADGDGVVTMAASADVKLEMGSAALAVHGQGDEERLVVDDQGGVRLASGNQQELRATSAADTRLEAADRLFLNSSASASLVMSTDADLDLPDGGLSVSAGAGEIAFAADASAVSLAGCSLDARATCGGDSSSVTVISEVGTGAAAVKVEAVKGGVEVSADKDLSLDSTATLLGIAADVDLTAANTVTALADDGNLLIKAAKSTSETAVEIDAAKGHVTLTAAQGVHVAAANTSEWLLEADEDGDDLRLAVRGAYDTSLVLESEGTSEAAVIISAPAGGMAVSTADATHVEVQASQDGDDLTLEVSGATDSSVVVRSSGTGSDAVRIEASAGGAHAEVYGNVSITSEEGDVDVVAVKGKVTAVADDDMEVTSGAAIAVTAESKMDLAAGQAMVLSASAASRFEVASDTDGEDLTLSLTGATDSSVVVSSSGTGSDAIKLATSAGGVAVDAEGSATMSARGALSISSSDEGLSAIGIEASAGGVSIDAVEPTTLTVASNDNDDDLTLRVTGATNSSIKLLSEGIGPDAIRLEASAGGIDVDVDDLIDIYTAGDLSASATKATVSTSAELELLVGSSATLAADDEISIDSSNKGISLAAASQSSFSVASSADGDDLKLAVTGATDSTLELSSAGTGDHAIQLATSAGGISLDAASDLALGASQKITVSAGGDLTAETSSRLSLLSEGNINASTAGDLNLESAGEFAIRSVESVFVNTRGDITLSTERSFAVDAVSDSSIAITGADLLLEVKGETDARLSVNSNGTADDALKLTAGAGGVDISSLSRMALDTAGNMSLVTSQSMDVVSADASSWILSAQDDQDDLTLSVKGSTDSSLVLSSEGTGSDAIKIDASAGGVELIATGSFSAIAATGVDLASSDSMTMVASADIALAADQDVGISADGELNLAAAENSAWTVDDASLEFAVTGETQGVLTLSSNGSSVDAITLDATSGGVKVAAVSDISISTDSALTASADGGVNVAAASTSTISVATDAAGEDLTLSVTGTTDSSLVLSSSGTGADAVSVSASAGGVVLSAAGAIDLGSSGGSVSVSATNDVDVSSGGAISVGASSGIEVDAGSGAMSLDATSGVTVIASSGNVSVSAAGGGVELSSDAASSFSVTSSSTGDDLTLSVGGATDSSLVLSSAGTGSDAILLTTSAGGLSAAVASDASITSTGAGVAIQAETSLSLTAEESDISVTARNGTIDIKSYQGGDAVNITADGGNVYVGAGGSTTIDVGSGEALSLTQASVERVAVGASGSVTVSSEAGADVTLSSGGQVVAAAAAGSPLLLRQGTSNRVTFSSAGGVAVASATSEAISLTSGGAVSLDAASGNDFSLTQGGGAFVAMNGAGELTLSPAAGANVTMAANGGAVAVEGDHVTIITGADFTVAYNESGVSADLIAFDDLTGALSLTSASASGTNPTLTLTGVGVTLQDTSTAPTTFDFQGGLDLDTPQMSVDDTGSNGVTFSFSAGATFQAQSGSSISFAAANRLEFSASSSDMTFSTTSGSVFLSSGSDVTVESDGDVTITVGNAMEIETSSTFTVLSDDNVKFISTGGYVRIDADDIQLKGLPTSDPSITNGIYVDTSTGNIKMSGY